MTPEHIGRYDVERRLGGGGMAEVFLASLRGAEGFSRRVAIKRVLPYYADRPELAALFVREAQLSAQLHHPNVVSVLDFERDADRGLFLVMELVEGKDLSQLLATGRIPISLAIFLAIEVLRGLGYAHHLATGEVAGLVHRDVSPQNVLLSWEGSVKVSDFGIAKARAATLASESVVVKGKVSYMSPEQADGRPLDGRSDLFAVGVMLWEMLVGRSPFRGNSSQEVLASLFLATIPPPSSLCPEVAEDLSRVVMRLLERDLAQRYATAEEALNDLTACRDMPRDGRAELAEILRLRFGEEVVRPPARSSVPSRSSVPAGSPLPAPTSSRPSVPSSSPFHPTMLAPSGPSRVSAPATPPAAPPSPRRAPLRLLGAFTAALAAAALATAGLVALVPGRDRAPEPGKREHSAPLARPEGPSAARESPAPPPASPDAHPSPLHAGPTSAADVPEAAANPTPLASPPASLASSSPSLPSGRPPTRRPVKKTRATGFVEVKLGPAQEGVSH
jgi:serine/threonine-protein kinase